ncbi:MAG: DEAD/DEAH box helicase family protein [Bacteroidales bacterium]|nr:DEAD/DEAH box helicase family protein [Bacteroidales bacterium]
MDKLPENTVLNKGLTGCGATTLAIQEKRDTIIAVPFTALIDNKTANPDHKDILLGLYGETPDDFRSEITAYVDGHPQIKIMTTYDSLPKVCSTLTALRYDPYNRMHLAIDEWHLLMMNYGFRGNTIRNLLAEAKHFKTVTYMSATPINREY